MIVSEKRIRGQTIMHNHVARREVYIINDGESRTRGIAVINSKRFHTNCKQHNTINNTLSRLCILLLCPSRIFKMSLVIILYEKSRVVIRTR